MLLADKLRFEAAKVSDVPFLEDAFTEGSDIALSSHTSDVGGSWGSGANNAAITVLGASDEANNPFTDYYHGAHQNAVPSSANQWAECDARIDAGTLAWSGVVLRSNNGSPRAADRNLDAYAGAIQVSFSPLVGRFQIVRFNSSGPFVEALETYTIPGYSYSQTNRVKLQAVTVGSDVVLKGWLDGVHRLTHTDSSASKKTITGKVGILMFGAYADNLEAGYF